MGVFGKRELDRDKMAGQLVKMADLELLGSWGKPTEKTYLAALLVEQMRTNELLEELVRQRSATSA